MKDRSNESGSWWGDVVEGTRNLPIPQDLKDSLLFAEGFIGAAGSMVSETAIGAVDLTQIIGIASIDGVNRLTGGQTPEWMKRDLQGTADNLSSLAELGVGTYTALTDPGAAQRGQDPNASYADKAAYRAQETGKALWDKVTHMDAYDAGGLTFEIASLFVGPAAVGKMAKGTKLGAKAAEMINLAKNSTKARVLANVEKWGSKVDNILAKSNNVIRQFGEKLLDTRIPVSIRQEAFAFAGGMGTMPTFSVESKTLREVMHFSSKHAEDVARGVGGSGKAERFYDDIIPTVKNGKFNEWFDNLAPEELEKLWEIPELRKKIEDRIRRPGGYHEWHLVSRTPQFKKWGVSMDDIKEMRSLIEDVQFINPRGVHGGRGSTKAHNEILKIIDSSYDYEEFAHRLNEWASRRMKNGILDLPEGLRRY